MRRFSRKLKSERGQSTTELALMMPVIFAMFFWAFQAQIILAGMHQAAYASFAGARSLVVKHNGNGDPQTTMDKILTGQIFKKSINGAASIQESMREPGSTYNTNDGVKIHLPAFASLPYARGLLNFDLDIPAHLGPSEWDMQVYNEPIRDQEMGPACWQTDNNNQDAGSC